MPNTPLNKEDAMDVVSYAESLGVKNYMYQSQTIKTLIAKAFADRDAAVREARIEENKLFPDRAKQILEKEYEEGLNAEMTGHGAWDIATFASRDRIYELRSQPNAKEGE